MEEYIKKLGGLLIQFLTYYAKFVPPKLLNRIFFKLSILQ